MTPPAELHQTVWCETQTCPRFAIEVYIYGPPREAFNCATCRERMETRYGWQDSQPTDCDNPSENRYTHYGCRCEGCRKANSRANRERKKAKANA